MRLAHAEPREGLGRRRGRRRRAAGAAAARRLAAEASVVGEGGDGRQALAMRFMEVKLPRPSSSLSASVACSSPTTPGSTPSTPASAHDGTEPGGGGSGNRSRYVGPPW